MKVRLERQSPADVAAIEELQGALGFELSESFKQFVLTSDGAEPETNIFRIRADNQSGVNRFIPVTEVIRERSSIETITPGAYPIAWAEGGNYVLVDEARDGAVFFWDHEQPDDRTELARSFGAFLDLLEPFDVQTVKLNPAQVKRVWIDPEFRKKLES